MRSLGKRAGLRQRWPGAACTACLLCLIAIGGQAWRTWRLERRGIEPPDQLRVERRPGINVELSQYDAGELDRVLDDIADLGVTWLRQRLPWQAIEAVPGAYDWGRWDVIVEATRRHNLRLIAVLDTFPEWARRHADYPLPCDPPFDTDSFERWASALASRYADVIDYYQVWDEPNLSQSWGGGHVSPCGYVALLQAGYRAVHGADPMAWVLGAGLAPTQAPGPDNLNDLTFLRGLYASGGGPYLDILAAKPYGFWTGPDDRRVAADVLNFSRAVAWREIMRAYGDAGKPIWAVEWGWHVRAAGRLDGPPPWGTDTLAVQERRILEAVRRARLEWPWMGVMCWADYRPAAASTSGRWGFALVASDGSATDLYAVIRVANTVSQNSAQTPSQVPSVLSTRWLTLCALMLLATADLGALWHIGRYRDTVAVVWAWWDALRPGYHAAALAVLAALYIVSPQPEWIAVELVLAAAILWRHPSWPLLGAAFLIPFSDSTKAIGDVRISPAETCLALAVVIQALRWWFTARHSQARSARAGAARPGSGLRIEQPWQHGLHAILHLPWSPLDLAWAAWVLFAAFSPRLSPDPWLAWREWRLCVLDPALLYGLLRWIRLRDGVQGKGLLQAVLLAWVASGVAVALIGIGQWAIGTYVVVGAVGRAAGLYYSPNHLALYLERLWPLALVWTGYGGRRWRLLMRIGASVLGVALYLTFSRGAWLLAIPIALGVLLIHYRDRVRWWAYAGAAGLVVLAALSVLAGRQAPMGALRQEVRWPVWQSALRMIQDYPWQGVGLDGFQFVYPRYMQAAAWSEPLLYHPHNMWLDAATRLGLPGLALFGVLIAGCVYEAQRMCAQAKSRPPEAAASRIPLLGEAVAIGCLAGLLAAMAHGMVDSGYFLADLAWSLGLVAGILAGQPVRPRFTQPPHVAGDAHA